ncbi:MAG: HEAT repeat domain-containing protein, partial [Polyangiales bacterium]
VKLGDATPEAPPAGEEPPEPSRRRPEPSGPAPDEPSVIVDMGDNVDDIVRELQLCGPDEEVPVVNAALGAGEAALPALVQHFPGPLWFDRRQPHRRLPRGRDVSAIARAIVAFGERAVPYISSLLGGGDDDVRFYATLLASELLHPSLVASLGRRIFDSDPGVRALVLDVLRLYQHFDTEYDELLQGIRAEGRVPRKDHERRTIAIRALGELRDVKSLSMLVELLKERDRQVVEAAHRSLVVLTRQDFGPSHRRWVSWFERNEDRHRIEWLIDALVHNDEDIRAAAGEELKQLTQEYHGFHPGMPKREREVCRKKYREWWESEGRERFTGASR